MRATARRLRSYVPRLLRSVDDFAAVIAHVQHFPGDRRDDVLARLLGDEGSWDDVVRDGPATIPDRASTRRFTKRLAEVRARLEAERTRLEDVRPLAGRPDQPSRAATAPFRP